MTLHAYEIEGHGRYWDVTTHGGTRAVTFETREAVIAAFPDADIVWHDFETWEAGEIAKEAERETPTVCRTAGCGHARHEHAYGSCTKCQCYVYDPAN